jgi:hypothetical protein
VTRFRDTLTAIEALEAERTQQQAVVNRSAQLRKQLVPGADGVDFIAMAVVQSSCCAVEMGMLTTGISNEVLVWLRPSGWREIARAHWQMTRHAHHLIKRGRAVHGVRRGHTTTGIDYHPEARHCLPLLLDCPQCGSPQWLRQDRLKVPEALSQPWRGTLPGTY